MMMEKILSGWPQEGTMEIHLAQGKLTLKPHPSPQDAAMILLLFMD